MYVNKYKPAYLLADETLEFERHPEAASTVVDGLRVHAGDDVIRFTCRGSVQTLSGRDLSMQPEGQTIDGQLNFWVWFDDTTIWPQSGDLVKREEIYQGGGSDLATVTQNYLVDSALPRGAYVKCRLVRDPAQVIKNG